MKISIVVASLVLACAFAVRAQSPVFPLQCTDANGHVWTQAVSPITSPTATPSIPTATPTPAQVNAFNYTYIQGNLIQWILNTTVPPVADVNVYDPSGAQLPNLRGPAQFTYEYRAGGFPIPGVPQTTGATTTTIPHGVFVFKAYNDAGAVIETQPATF